jgi:O-methyltransferase
MFNIINSFLGFFGYRLHSARTNSNLQNLNDGFLDLYKSKKWKEYTMVDLHNLHALYQAIHYIVKNHIPGCMMFAAQALMSLGDTGRDLWLFDTFAGMSAPSPIDKKHGTKSALEVWGSTLQDDKSSWCYSSLHEVQENMYGTGYPKERLHFIKGDVAKTLTKQDVGTISLLRLDTDWYESTKLELEILFPKIAKEGVLIVDDYGTWDGAKKACDDYFMDKHLLLARMDHTARMGLKL